MTIKTANNPFLYMILPSLKLILCANHLPL